MLLFIYYLVHFNFLLIKGEQWHGTADLRSELEEKKQKQQRRSDQNKSLIDLKCNIYML